MKMTKPISIVCLLLLQLTVSAQVQWYQNQDGSNPPPYGTVATTVQPFTSNSFVACYLWSSTNELNTWKISKSNINGAEMRTFFTTGISSTVEFKVGKNNTVYVFQRSFTPDFNPEYIIYKLDANLNIVTQRNLEFPNGYFVYNIGAFEIDEQGNVYFAGDGQYPNAGGSFSPASFVLKTNKNLVNTWQRMDSSETSFTRLLIDHSGRVLVVQDHYSFFPQVRIKRYTSNGQVMNPFTVETDINRYSLCTQLDDDDNIIMYGGKTVDDVNQAVYLKRISRFSGTVAYSKTYFTSPSTQLNDLKIDEGGNIFTLVTEYFGPGDQKCKISRINLSNGTIGWNRTMDFTADSCNLSKLVLADRDNFYAIGERRSLVYFSKGFAMKVKKNGQFEGNFPSPDSVAYQRSHWLADAMVDNNSQLIAIGNTSDFDTMTFSNTYFRSFAVRFGRERDHGCYGKGGELVMEEATDETDKTEDVELPSKIALYPNPVQNELTVRNIDPEKYDQLTVFNLLGVKLRQQAIGASMARVDISTLPDGVYIAVLHSSVAMKDVTIKFMVKK